MLLQSFHLLDFENQQQYIYNHGIHLFDRQEPEFFISLYALDNFYVELYVHNRSSDILQIDAFTSIERLEPYLHGLDIKQLL